VERQTRHILVHGGGLIREGTRTSMSGRCGEHEQDQARVKVMGKMWQVSYV
jgi:hypothetical protein